MNDLEERFSNALHSTSRSWRQAVDRRLKYLGVSQASWMTIAFAAKARSPLSQSELADKLGLTKSGFRLVFNNGPDAGEAVPHLHCHILGGRALGWPPG